MCVQFGNTPLLSAVSGNYYETTKLLLNDPTAVKTIGIANHVGQTDGWFMIQPSPYITSLHITFCVVAFVL